MTAHEYRPNFKMRATNQTRDHYADDPESRIAGGPACLPYCGWRSFTASRLALMEPNVLVVFGKIFLFGISADTLWSDIPETVFVMFQMTFRLLRRRRTGSEAAARFSCCQWRPPSAFGPARAGTTRCENARSVNSGRFRSGCSARSSYCWPCCIICCIMAFISNFL